jgi:hypothetical protein
VPIARGGLDENSNVLPACHRCNSDKRDLLLHEWKKAPRPDKLFAAFVIRALVNEKYVAQRSNIPYNNISLDEKAAA